MPRDIPVGNGQMLVTFDQHYQIRDLFFPHVGQENHAGGGPCRFGVWSTLKPREHGEPDRRKARLYWTNQGWTVKLRYQPDTLATDVTLTHPDEAVELRCCDVVDFHRPMLVRRIEVRNLADYARDIHLFHHHDFNMYGTKVGDTAYFDPQLRCLIHYRSNRYIMATWHADGEQRIDEYATGTAGFQGAEGTWRDAEDGQLSNNAIAQGAVDSTMMVQLHIAPHGKSVVYMVIGAGKSHQDIQDLHHFLHREGPQGVIDRTMAYWRLWLTAARMDIPMPAEGGPSESVTELFKRSLLVVRSQIDNATGSIIAANDSDIMQFSRDTYSYLWPRDGALGAAAMDEAGFPDVARSFYSLCSRIISDQGYFFHKYNPDGSPASSWHPWVSLGNPQLPIQEDETALVLWAVWRHFLRYRDIEFVRPMWVNLITKAADFLVRFRDPDTHLPLPCYNLWEDTWGVHAFTVATVYAGLQAAWQFAVCFGDTRRAAVYGQAVGEVRDAFNRHFWSDKHDRFLRRIVPLDHDRTARLMAEVMAGRTPNPDAAEPFPGLAPGHAARKNRAAMDNRSPTAAAATIPPHQGQRPGMDPIGLRAGRGGRQLALRDLCDGDARRPRPARRQDHEGRRVKAVAQDRRGGPGSLRKRHLPTRQPPDPPRSRQPVVHLHALARPVADRQGPERRGAARGVADHRLGRRARAALRRPGGTGASTDGRAAVRVAADLEPRGARLRGDRILAKTRTNTCLPNLRTASPVRCVISS